MRNNPWPFGMLFLILSGIWMYHNFELPKFYPFEKTLQTEALVFQSRRTDPRVFGLGERNDLIVKFIYKVGNTRYISKHRAYKLGQYQRAGDSLLIEYSVNDPSRTRPVSYYKNATRQLYEKQIKRSYGYIKSNGYKNLLLKEHLFYYEDYAEYGKCLVKTTGTYKTEDGILRLTPMIYYKSRMVQGVEIEESFPINTIEEQICLSDFIVKENSLLEIETNIIFDLAGSK